MLESTFQLARGIGPLRERRLWRAGVARWRDLADAASSSPSLLPPAAARTLRAAVDDAATAFAARDADRLAALVPARERWRLFAAFGDDAAYLDIETSDDVVGFAGISAIGVLDRRGPTLLLAGRDLRAFPALAAGWKMLVTFNGLSFDVPILRRAFPAWQPPVCHVDLRHLLERLGHGGGLKSIERRLTALGLVRPGHLDGLDGWDASRLFHRGRDGDRAALRLFAEYNLLDAIHLRTLMAWAYNEQLAAETRDAPALRSCARAVPVPGRGDVLYDVSKILLSL
ncbi:MAG TPA: ribonuclease H-like domain-containing protein [Polyangia bacterium]